MEIQTGLAFSILISKLAVISRIVILNRNPVVGIRYQGNMVTQNY